MDVYVCWDGDKIGRRVGRAVLGDDVGEVRQVDQAINAGNELWRNFAVNVGGTVIEIGGDEGRIAVDASRLSEVPGVADRYAQRVGATVSVGVGMKLSESAKALMVAKLRGGNKIVVWDESMQAEYDAVANAPKTEQDKLKDEYLAKADTPEGPKSRSAGGQDIALVMQHNTKKLTGPNAGFAVQHDPGFTTMKPGDSEDPSVPAPDAAQPDTSTGVDFEKQLHGAAQDQSTKDAQSSQDDQKNNEALKKKITEALKKVRENLPLIAQMQQRSPEAYKAILGLVQGVILLGKQVMGKDMPPDEEPQHVKEALGKAEESKEESKVEKAGETSTTPPAHGELDMAETPAAGNPENKRGLKLPVGAVVDQAMKVKHGDGRTSWKKLHSGMVQAQDPGAPLYGANSHPVSSREPSAD